MSREETVPSGVSRLGVIRITSIREGLHREVMCLVAASVC